MHMAQDQNDDDDDTFGNVDQYFADHGYDGDFMGPPSQEPNPTKDVCDLARTTEKPSCNRRRLAFSSQETPPAADFTEPQIGEVRNIISPNTLKKAVCEQNSVPLQEKKKARKRKTKKGASQPAPSTIRAQDGPPSPKDISRRVHVAGRPMLPTNLLNAATGALRSLHDSVLSLEKRRLFENDVAYPIFVAKPQIGEVRNIISPNTLKKAVCEQNSVPLQEKKKARKRKTKKGASQPAPSTIRAQDGPPSPKDISRRVHVAGRPMLPTNLLNAATGALRSLHDSVLSLEKRRLFENDVAYPIFVAKVPEGKGIVDSAIGGTIVLWSDDIFAMFNLHPLHYTFVRLFSLSMEMRAQCCNRCYAESA